MPPSETFQDETIHFQLLKELDQAPQQSQRALSSALGISLGKLNYCLRALVVKGWVKAGNFRRNPHKRRYAYLLTPEGIEAKARLTARFLQRKMAEYDRLGKEIEELRQAMQAVRPANIERENGSAGMFPADHQLSAHDILDRLDSGEQGLNPGKG